jgi:hypothetical protein
MAQELDRKDLKVQALLEKISSLTTQYENQVADLRVELTVSELENQSLRKLVEELESSDVQEEDSSSSS